MSNTPHDLQKIQGVEKQAMDQAFKDSLKGFMSKDTQIQKQIEEASHKIMEIVNRHGENTSEGEIYWNREYGWDKKNSNKYNAEEDCRKEIAQFIATIATKSAEVERERILGILQDMEDQMGTLCNDSQGTQGCEEENSIQWVRKDLEQALSQKEEQQ